MDAAKNEAYACWISLPQVLPDYRRRVQSLNTNKTAYLNAEIVAVWLCSTTLLVRVMTAILKKF